MRGELPPALASVSRGSGVAGSVAALAGSSAVVAITWPWHEAAAELAMMGIAQNRAVAAIVGWATIAGWTAAIAGAVATGLGVALALDRHPGWTRPGLLCAAAALAVAGTWAQLRQPALDRFPDAAGALADLRAVVADLPQGVELSITVRAGAGVTVTLLASITVLVAAAAARDLDQR